MSRVIMIQATDVSGIRLGAGKTIADTSGNAVAGDLVWATLPNAPAFTTILRPALVRPLDAAAQTALATAGFPGIALWVAPRRSREWTRVCSLEWTHLAEVGGSRPVA